MKVICIKRTSEYCNHTGNKCPKVYEIGELGEAMDEVRQGGVDHYVMGESPVGWIFEQVNFEPYPESIEESIKELTELELEILN